MDQLQSECRKKNSVGPGFLQRPFANKLMDYQLVTHCRQYCGVFGIITEIAISDRVSVQVIELFAAIGFYDIAILFTAQGLPTVHFCYRAIFARLFSPRQGRI